MELSKNLRYEATDKLVEYANQTGNDVMKELARRLQEATMPKTNEDHARGKFMARTLSDFVNSYNFDKEGFVKELMSDHNTLQQSAISLMLFTIEQFAAINPGRVDGRNRRAVETCRKISDFMEANGLTSNLPLLYSDEYGRDRIYTRQHERNNRDNHHQKRPCQSGKRRYTVKVHLRLQQEDEAVDRESVRD